VQIVFDGHIGEQSIAQKAFGENASGPSSEGVVASSAVTLLQFIADNLFTDWVHINNGAGFAVLGVQGSAAVGALVWSGYPLLTGNLIVGNAAPPVSPMAGFGTTATL